MRPIAPLVLGGICLLAVACQGSPSPTTAPEAGAPSSLVYVPAVGLLNAGEAPAYEGTLGAWTLAYSNQQATLTPARSALATPGLGTFEVDITAALTNTFCNDCLRVTDVNIDGNGQPVLTLEARHPFDLGDPGLPPTAQNRRDLFIYNVKGILVGSKDPISIGDATLPSSLLTNPDGFLTVNGLFDTGALAETAFPYMVFNVDEGLVGTGNFNAGSGAFADMTNPSGFNVLGQGTSGSADFTLDIAAGESVSFDFRLVARYGQSVIDKTFRLAPTYYPAQIASGPWRVNVDPVNSFTTNPADFNNIIVNVWDFAQAHGNFDAGYPSADYLGISWDPDLAVSLEIPAFSPTAFVPGGLPTGTGAIGDPLIYTLTVNNDLAAANGFYPGLLKVTSNRPVGSSTPTEASDVTGIAEDLNAGNLIDIPEIANYQPLLLEVSTVAGMPPVADLAAVKTELMVGNGTYFYPGPGTMDPDGSIVEYAYDFDWNGSPASFVADETNVDGAPVSTRFPTVANVTVGMRVKDNDANFAYDSVVVDVQAVGDPFPPSHPMNTFPSEAEEIFIGADHQVMAIDSNNPNNVYILQDSINGSADEHAIYRSKDFGRTFDTGTPIESTLKSHAGDNFPWISGKGLTVLADGTLGFVCNTTSTAGVDGRGIYYAWIDVDQAGTGVDAGAGTHDLLRVNMVTALEAWGDPGIWADINDPTRVYVTYIWNPTGVDEAKFAIVSNANTANPTRLLEDAIVTLAENRTLNDLHSYLDPATNDLHMVWTEFQTSVDRWVAYTRIHLNNPVGPKALYSAVAQHGGIVNLGYPTVGVTTGGQAVCAFSVDYDVTSGSDYDMAVVKVLDNSGTQSFITPSTRIINAVDGDNKAAIFGDRTTGRICLAFTTGGINGFGTPLDLSYVYLDSSLSTITPVTRLHTMDPTLLYRHDDPYGAIDPNTGELFYMWNDQGVSEATAWRWSR